MTLSIMYLSQSCFQLQTGQRCVYFDPGTIGGAGPLPKADLILVSHHHPDHIRKGTIAALTGDDTLAVGPGKTRRKLGARKMIINPGESVDIKGIAISAVHAYNPPGSRGLITYHRKGAGVGYVLTIDGRRIYHAGDTGLIEEMRSFGPLDLAFLPIGGRFTMDVREAVEAAGRIKAQTIVPMHALKADPFEFKRWAESSTEAMVVVLAPGEEFSL